LAAVVSYALTDPDALALGFFGDNLLPVGSMPTLWESIVSVATAQGTYPALVIGLGVGALGALLELGGAVSTWFLVSRRVRQVFWAVADVVVLFGFVAVALLLPFTPPEDAPDQVTLPAISLAVTTVFCVRLLFRALPFILDGIEQIGFRSRVAARMLRARKSGFLTTIGALSIMAVAFSSCTLTTTLSVMGGFRNDLKRKILGNNAHVVIDEDLGTFEGWDPTLETVRGTEGVVAATPYVQGEVMITSATNLGGAVIRGIDPETIGDVTELPDNLRHGRMEYLRDPERLLRLRAEEMGRGLLAPPMTEDGEPAGAPGERGSVFGDAEDVLEGVEAGDGSAPGEVTDPDTARIERDIEEFLLPEARDAGPAEAPDPIEQDVLPGLIVGQELARTLRLHVGDEVNVVSPLGDLGPSGPMPKTRPFRIAGIFYSGMYEFDMKMAYTTLEAAQGFLGVGDAISGIEVKVEDTDRAEPIAEAIAAAIDRPQLRVRAWQEVNRNLFGALQLEKLAMFITLGIAILVASFCIVGTLTLMVQEKGKEVGILKAMGASGEQMVAVFMAQGLMIGLLGAAMGLGLGYVTCFAMEHFGVHLNPEVYYIDRLPVHVDPMEFVLTGIAAVIVCLLATIYPAILGSRLRPVDALRFA
jgi:lipoprotein-releasing system permease protein